MKKFWLKIFILFAAAVTLFPASARAATFTITADTNWSAIAGGPPTSSDAVVVKNGAILTVDVGTAVAASIQLGSGGGSSGAGTLAFNTSQQVTVSGATTVGASNYSGTVDMTNGGTLITGSIVNGASGSGTFTFTPGTGTLRITTTSSLPAQITDLYNLTLSTSSITVSLSGDLTVSHQLGLSLGTLAAGGYTLILSGTGTPLVITSGNLTTSGTVRYTGDGATVRQLTYNTLELMPSGSNPQALATGTFNVNTITIGDGIHAGAPGATGATGTHDINLNGVMTVAANATYTSGAGNTQFIGGYTTPLVVNGTFNSVGGTVLYMYNGSNVTPTNYYNLTLTGNACVMSTGTTNIAGTFAVNGSGTDTTSNPNVTAGNVNVTASVAYTTGTGIFTVTGSAASFGSGTFTPSAGSTMVFTGNGITPPSTLTYSNLELKPSGSTAQVLASGTYTINNNLTVGDGSNAGASGATNGPVVNIGGNLTVNSGATFTTGTGAVTLSGAGKIISGTAIIPTLTINNTTTNNGTLTVGTALGGSNTLTQGSGATLNIGGSSGISGLNASTNSNTVVYNGTTADQTVKNVTYRNLTIDKGSYKANLGANLTVNDTLTFASGNISTGANKVIIPSGGSISRTSGHVVGNLQMYMPTGATSKTLVIGDASNYTPVDVAFGNVSVAGNVTAYTTAGDHPSIASSGIDAAKSVNRYWTMTKDGTLAFDNYSATLNFAAGDIDGGANTNNFIVAKYTSSVWSQPTVGSKSGTSTQATGLTAFSDFQVGEAEGGGGAAQDVNMGAGVNLNAGVTITP